MISTCVRRLVIAMGFAVFVLAVGVITSRADERGCKDENSRCTGVNAPWTNRSGFCMYKEEPNACACDFSTGNGGDYEQQNFCKSAEENY